MRTLAFVLILASPQFSHADELIIPVYAHIVHGSDGSFGSGLRITNLARRDVTVRIAKTYAASWMDACASPLSRTISPAATTWIYPPDGCRGILAFVLDADGPVQIQHDISMSRGPSAWHTQRVGTMSGWLPPFQDAMLAAVRIDLPSKPDFYGPFRTNLFVVNPNDEALRFELTIQRLSQAYPSREEVHDVAPRSVLVIAVEGIPDRWCDGDSGPHPATVAPNCSTAYDLTFRADRPYLASASTVARGGDGQFHEPAVLENW